MAKTKSVYLLPIIAIVFALCLMLVFSVFMDTSASAEQSVEYIDIDLKFVSTNIYTGAAIEVTAAVWESEDNNSWEVSDFDGYEIRYYSGTTWTQLAQAPSAVGSYTARAIATANANGLRTTQGILIDTGVTIKSFTYNIVYNHFAISYNIPSSLVADGSDYIGDVGASIYCEGSTLVEGVDYEVEIFFADMPTAEVIEVGLYTIEVTMLVDFATSNVFASDLFTYEFIMVASEVTATLENNKLYYNALPNAPVIEGNITTDAAFYGNYDVYYIKKIGTTTNGYSMTALAPSAEGDYICRIIFNTDVPEYGIAANDHIDLSFQIVPKPYMIVYEGDGASFSANNAIVQQSTTSGMNVTATFTNLLGQPLNITTNDYVVTYWYYNTISGEFLDLPVGEKPLNKGRYQIRLTFNKEIPQSGQNTFGSAHPDYKILLNEVITYEFQIVNPVTYVVGNAFVYTGSPVNISTSLLYGTLPINNSPSQTIYQVRYIYNEVENEVAPTNVGSYVGIIRFLENFNSGSTTVAEIGDEYRFNFSIYYPSPSISITYNASNFNVECVGKASFVEGVDYELANYIYKDGIYYEISDLSAVGLYRTIITIIAEDKAKGLLIGDTYVKVTTIEGGNPAIIKLNNPNLAYNGNAKPVTPSFGAGITRTLHQDYTITYFVYKNGVIDSECGYPILPGDYRAIMTFIKADTYFGIPSGYKVIQDYTIAPMAFVVYFTPSDGKDLVYDKEEKLFDVAFTANNRPVTIEDEDYTVMYRAQGSTNYADFVETGYINAGTYRVAVVFDTDVGYKQYGISIEENNYVKEQLFSISSLMVRLNFGLPVEEESMYRAGGVEPLFTFYKTNNGLDELTTVPLRNEDFEIDYLEGDILGIAYNETPILGIPTSTNRYLSKVTMSNPNITISLVTKDIIGAHAGINYNDICYAIADQQSPSTKAQAAYRIIPLPLTINADFPESMFEDGTGKGCDAEDLLLSTIDVASGVGGVFDTISVNNILFDNLISVEYFIRQSGGTAVIGDPLGSQPTAAGDYTLRVNFNKSGEDEPFVFTCYRIVGGMDSDGELSDLSIHTGYYFDISYRIEEPDEIRVIFDKPASFAYDGTAKAFNIRFSSGDFAVNIDSEDYEIVYYSQSGGYSGVPFSSVTGASDLYTIQVSFKKDFPQYKIVQIEGVYNKDNPAIDTITENDVVSLSYRIFNPFILDWEWIAPSSFYYDGAKKAYSIRFFDANNYASTVTLIYNIDYAIRYYKKVGANSYSLLTSIPTVPMVDADSYIAELVFLRALPDFRMLKLGDETHYQIVSYVTAKAQKDGGEPYPVGLSLQDNGGSFSDEMEKENRHAKFNIEKTTLIVSGISAQNKSFDNTKTATIAGTPVLTVKKDALGKSMGGMVLHNGVFIYQLSGAITAEFTSVSAGANKEVNIVSGYALPDGGAYYNLEYQPLKANINKLNINITPVSTPRQYNPFFVDADNLSFTITAVARSVLASALSIDEGEVISGAFIGALTRVGAGGVNDNVGSYDIRIGTLALAGGSITLSDASTSTLADNITLTLIGAKYNIVPRQITITVDAGQSKNYGDADPSTFTFTITNGSLLFNDAFVGIPTRQSGESSGVKDRVGFYSISLAPIRIFDRNGLGEDVTSNYSITRVSKPFEVKKKNLLIAANNQTITYGQGNFNPLSLKVNNITVTPANIFSILRGDVFAGALGLEDTGVRTAVIARRYRITRGTLSIRSAAGLDVTHNYNVVFDTVTAAFYTINKFNLNLRVSNTAVLTKTYGDNDPRIAFSVVGTALDPKYTFHAASTLGRVAGENVGSYNLLANNATGGIRVLESGKNVTEFFNIEVNVRDEQNQIMTLAIVPREIIIGVRSETVQKSNRTILPSLVYYDIDGKELSQDILSTLKVGYVVPNINYVEGENVLTPVITGSVLTDDNFIISLVTGTITVVYPENTVVNEPIDTEDLLFTSNKIVYSDFRVFNSVKMYHFTTESGDSPTRLVKASIPITEEFAGKNIYVMAVYGDGSINLLNATIEGNEIVFEDDDFFYILVGTLAIWPYIIVGVLVIVLVGGGAAMLISYLLRRKKRIAAGLITPKTKKSKKKTKAEDKALTYEEIEKEVKASEKYRSPFEDDNSIAEIAHESDVNADEEMIVSSNISRLEVKEEGAELDSAKTIELSDEDGAINLKEAEAFDTKSEVEQSDTFEVKPELEVEEDDYMLAKAEDEEIVKTSNSRRFEDESGATDNGDGEEQ